MKVLVTGAAGLLGSEVSACAGARGHDVTGLRHAELDVTDARQVGAIVREAAPAAVVQCAAFTQVDAAEAEPELAMRVNRDGARHVAEACSRVGARFVYVSTDYVFDGARSSPYPTDAEVNPLSVYGVTKAEGERAAVAGGPALVVRTSWLFGSARANFVTAMIARAARGERLRVVDDQEGCPSSTRDVAEALLDLLEVGATGTWHVVNTESCSRAELAREALRMSGLDTEVVGVSSEAWGALAQRPRYSALDVAATEARLGRRLRPWWVALADFLDRGDIRGGPKEPSE